MRTHKNVTDKYERSIIADLLCYIRSLEIPFPDRGYEYCHFPFGENIYGTYDMKNKKLVRVEYRTKNVFKKIKTIVLV